MADAPGDGVEGLPTWHAPRASEVGADVDAFLARLGGPSFIAVGAELPGRTRVLTTLLHGNEPSGTIAIHRFLREGVRPRVPLLLAIMSVEAASGPPRFANRARAGGKDLNRCFRPPWEGIEGARASALMERVRAAQPEAIVDLHNTSGRGPAYAVCTGVDPQREALTALFAQRIIKTDLRLHTFMEAADAVAPTVTIECGGARDPEAHERAFHGLCSFARADDVLARPPDAAPLQVLERPLRVELMAGASIAYAPAPVDGVDITLPRDVDRYNFGVMREGVPIGWLGPRGLSALRVVGSAGGEPVERYFRADGDRLCAVRDLEPLMVTTDADIARADCVFYLIALGTDA